MILVVKRVSLNNFVLLPCDLFFNSLHKPGTHRLTNNG